MKTGFVVTRTTLLATEVNFKELIQKEKCRDRKSPPIIARASCFFVKLENRIPLIFAMVNKIADDIVKRYVAIIIDGTSLQNFIKIEAKEIATIPTDTKKNTLNKIIHHFYFFYFFMLDNF